MLNLGQSTWLVALDPRVVENTWALKQKTGHVDRVFFSFTKHPSNPVIADEGGWVTTVQEGSVLKAWFMTAMYRPPAAHPDKSEKCMAYLGESIDGGVTWTRPEPDLPAFNGFTTFSGRKHIIYDGPRPGWMAAGQVLLAPEGSNYEYWMVYRGTGGTRVVGSNDGVNWEPSSDVVLHEISADTQSTLVPRPSGVGYLLYTRPRHVYGLFGGRIINNGQQRRVAVARVDEMFPVGPPGAAVDVETIMSADELSNGYTHIYACPVTCHASGLYLAYPHPFRLNDAFKAELAWSQDGYHWQRPPVDALGVRPQLLAQGAPLSWDSWIIAQPGYFESPDGTEYRMLYQGWDGPHEWKGRNPGQSLLDPEIRNPGIGLASIRKDGFAALRGPIGDAVVSLYPTIWPGGQLHLNIDNVNPSYPTRVRITAPDRRDPADSSQFGHFPGFGWSEPVTSGLSSLVVWPGANINSLTNQPIRIEILLGRDSDLFTVQAVS